MCKYTKNRWLHHLYKFSTHYVKRIATSDVYTRSQLHSVWFSALYYIAIGQYASVYSVVFSFFFLL